MQRKILSILSCIICFLFVSCSGNSFSIPTATSTFTPTPSILSVPSLKEKLSVLESSAHNVENDSYLVRVVLRRDKNQPFSVQALYYSANKPDIWFFVEIDHFDKISTRRVDIEHFKSDLQTPIDPKDWLIDSPEALSSFANNTVVSSCLESSEVSVEMSLDRVGKKFLVWELILWGCPDKHSFKIYDLDARTGEVAIDFIK